MSAPSIRPSAPDVAEARRLLAAIDHPWLPDGPDPGERLARAPQLLADLRQLVTTRRTGRSIDPSLLRRPLGHGLDLATLLEEGALPLGSAFLFGALLQAEPAAGAAALKRWINTGAFHITADGQRERRLPRLAGRFPQCRACGMRRLHDEGPCTHGVDPLQVDPKWIALIDAIEAAGD
jgi:hypothetical protein